MPDPISFRPGALAVERGTLHTKLRLGLHTNFRRISVTLFVYNQKAVTVPSPKQRYLQPGLSPSWTRASFSAASPWRATTVAKFVLAPALSMQYQLSRQMITRWAKKKLIIYYLRPEIIAHFECHVFFLRLFWVGHTETFLRRILFRLQWTHAMFFIDSSDIKFRTFLNYVFHNVVNETGAKNYQ